MELRSSTFKKVHDGEKGEGKHWSVLSGNFVPPISKKVHDGKKGKLRFWARAISRKDPSGSRVPIIQCIQCHTLIIHEKCIKIKGFGDFFLNFLRN